MQLKIKDVLPDLESIVPVLNIAVEITYYDGYKIPLSISGKLVSGGGKVVSFINEQHNGTNITMRAIALHPDNSRKISGNKNFEQTYSATLTSPLSQAAIEYIENIRQKDFEKAVRFSFRFEVKTFEMTINDSAQQTLKMDVIDMWTSGYVIKHSDWVRTFSPYLGIGNFLLLELKIPDAHNVNAEWDDLYKRLSLRLTEMDEAIKHGDWQKAMDRGRQLFENLKIGDDKKGHAKFKEDLIGFFKADQHTDEGIQNFIDGIWQFFLYSSKFVHDKDTKGNLHKVLPIPRKEDAYFIYALGVSLLNVIGKKISKE